jgi:hypothetical protein
MRMRISEGRGFAVCVRRGWGDDERECERERVEEEKERGKQFVQ